MPEGRLAGLVRALADLTARAALPRITGSELRQLRSTLGMTQAQMAELVEPGMRRSRIADWELERHGVPQRYSKHLRQLEKTLAAGAA
jgi:DNA-binding transcriptional regulator YiaG